MPYALAEKRREARRKSERKRSFLDADIGEPPLTSYQKRRGRELREACENDLALFNSEVFPASTGLKPFGLVQRSSMQHDQAVVERGGRVCKAEPRAYGKTTRTGNCAMWSVLYGKRRMVPVFSASLDKSKSQIIGRWKTEILTNKRLLWMFPDLIWPLRCLEGTNHRAPRQRYKGKLTSPQWTAQKIVLPDVDGEPGAGGILIALPLKSCRGATHTTPRGTVLRPDLLIFDDVQADEDASNPARVKKIEDLIDHTAMMLGGHSQSISAIMNCTVRRAGDLSEIYLDKSGWSRVRYKMLTKPADNEEKLWLGEYAAIRRAYDPEQPGDDERAKRESLAFYRANRAAMDAGAEITWKWAFAWGDDNPTEISAIQHAYNILIDLGSSVFDCECQNEPPRESLTVARLSAQEAARKVSGYEGDVVPSQCDKLTAFIDVQGSLLYWLVAAWADDFAGHVINYGSYPEQPEKYYALSSARRTLQRQFPGHTDEAAIFQGLQSLFATLLGREWRREDGASMRISRCLVDANWGDTSALVNQACRQSPYAGLITPSYGRGIKATQKPISQWQQARGINCGPEWVPTKSKGDQLVGVVYNTNYWKKRFHDAFALPLGSPGCISLFNAPPEIHRMIGDHLAAEHPVRTEAGGRVVFEWHERPGVDNHLGDCAVGAMVAASMAGTTPREYQAQQTNRRRRKVRHH